MTSQSRHFRLWHRHLLQVLFHRRHRLGGLFAAPCGFPLRCGGGVQVLVHLLEQWLPWVGKLLPWSVFRLLYLDLGAAGLRGGTGGTTHHESGILEPRALFMDQRSTSIQCPAVPRSPLFKAGSGWSRENHWCDCPICGTQSFRFCVHAQMMLRSSKVTPVQGWICLQLVLGEALVELRTARHFVNCTL